MEHKVSADEIIRFGEFEIALKSGELRRNGEIIRLQPQPFKVLAFLVSHAGQTVTRQELQQAIWEEGTFVDFEHGLNFCIKQIRDALGDDAQAPRLVETLPRRGYRFIAQVEQVNGSVATGSESAPSEAARIPYPTSDRAHYWSAKRIIVIVAILATLSLAGFFALRVVNRVAPPSAKVMIAVLPFENLSGDVEQDYFSDGMTEEMIARLGSIDPERLGVIARTSAMTYKGVNKNITGIGRELGVGFVVEGSVRREQDRVRITAQLIQVSDQTHLWSESYDRPSSDVLKVQSEVADQIARALAVRLLGGQRGPSTNSVSAEGIDTYLRGRYLLNKGDRDSLRRSAEYFAQAIEKDPNYAAAFAGFADSYRLLGMYYAILPSEAYPKAAAAAKRAIELDPGNANAFVALGSIKFRYEWNWEEAERDFQRALELNPSLGMAHHDYAWYLVATKRFDEGIEHIRIAQRLDPLSPLANSDVGWVYLMARRYDDAIAQIERTLDLEPTFGSALVCLERAYLLKGQSREALESLSKQLGDSAAQFEREDPAEAINSLYRKRFEKTMTSIKTGLLSPYNVAMICIAAGERDRSFEFLEKAYVERDPMLVAAGTDPMFDVLRADPRFADLIRRIGFSK